MNSSILMVLLGLMGTVCSSFVCQDDCELTDRHSQQCFTHVSDLQSSSVAPWDLETNSLAGREPEHIPYAKCKTCTLTDMIAKPIYLKISVYQRISNGTAFAWCRCPYEVAVGCTCVSKQKQ